GFTVVGIDAFTPYYDRTTKERNLRTLDHGNFRFVEACVDSAAARVELDGAQAIIHLAAQPGVRDSWNEFDTYTELNVLATKRLLDFALDAGVHRFVCASSSSVYGDAPAYPTSEDAPTVPRSPYGITKLAAERLSVAYALERGLRTVSLRFFTVFGPGQRPDMAIERLIRAAHLGDTFPMFGDGSQIRDFTYVGDVARANAMCALVDLPPGTVFNVCSEAPTTLNQVIEIVETITGSEVRRDQGAVSVGDVRRTGGTAARIRAALGWSAETSIDTGIRAQELAVRERLQLVGARA
ncbi:MAG TPA: NAD-dependent epimerase/dehydratase family protein, partial [Ilumatobacter sp.]|nr:NAD-dependent epimerase/dehydratase family protein [Ilumatobacter sp.]